MGIKPLERKKKSYWSLGIKLSFLLLILLGAFFLFHFRRSKTPKKNNSVLGSEDVIEKKRGDTEGVMTTIQNDVKNVTKDSLVYAQNLANSAINNVTSLVNSTTSQSAKAVLGNVINQIDKLPKQEQDMIKQEICK